MNAADQPTTVKAIKGFKASRHQHLSVRERFWMKVSVRSDDACWIWCAASVDGYGSFKNGTRSVAAHRFAWEDKNGLIPNGLVIDHLCRNTLCVNPLHMEPVSIGENVRRGLKTYALRSTCKHGHDITDPANVKVRPSGRRECRVCARKSFREWCNRKAAA